MLSLCRLPMVRPILTAASVMLGSAIPGGCGLTPQRLPFDDPRVQELLRAADAASAHRFAFTSVSPDTDIRLERASSSYDRMLHVYGPTSRTIAFRQQADSFVWIGEQEIYKGPKTYTDVDGTHFEQIVVTYELQPISGYPINQLNIEYSGQDPRLASKENLALREVVPILREWDYEVEEIGREREPSTLDVPYDN